MRNPLVAFAGLVLFGCQGDVDPEDLRTAIFDDTTLCFPASFSPDTTFMDAFLSPIEGQLDSSDVQELIFIPAAKIRGLVPGYSETHINKYGTAVPNDLIGIAYRISSMGNPNGREEKAWNVRASSDPFFVEQDPELPLFRIYPFSEPAFMWYLVKAPPPKNPSGPPPGNWYVANCVDTDAAISCSQSATFQSVDYEYHLYLEDMYLRDEVGQAVTQLMAEWNENCDPE